MQLSEALLGRNALPCRSFRMSGAPARISMLMRVVRCGSAWSWIVWTSARFMESAYTARSPATVNPACA